ncbi:WD40-repeat-containing domain protein [Aspergillus ambiguus]|uniref:F-box and WD domain protein n=1 Tax=Aspergillus ambiguus TaxID=176160 RepID=UPI003CCDF725
MASDADRPPRPPAAVTSPNHHLTASSLSTPFKLDEGYSDEIKSRLDNGSLTLSSNDGMALPDWLLAQSEADRAELAYSLLRTLQTSSLAAIVDRITPLLHMDPVLKLPPEITFEIFCYLDHRTLLTASLASRAWRERILDPRLWRELYVREGWRVDIDTVRAYEEEHSRLPSSPQSRKSRSRHADTDLGEPKHKKRVPLSWLDSRATESLENHAVAWDDEQQLRGAPAEADPEGDHLMSDASNVATAGSQISAPSSRRMSDRTNRCKPNRQRSSTQSPSSQLLLRMPNGTAKINWLHLYHQRRRLEENWAKGRFSNFQLPHPAHMDECHRDFVYCIQFTGKWLVSGSRDTTIRVWDLETQRLCRPPLVGHTRSVLCLQFDPAPEEDLIISGGSDMNVIMWRFSTGEKIHEIKRAHDDSVLNLKYDHRYLITSSKDKRIKIWNRALLTPADKNYPQVHGASSVDYPSYIIDTSKIPSPVLEADLARGRLQPLAPYSLLMTLSGHSTAVNAVQMDEDEIVSASGDRLIKVWNLHNGTCKRTLPGHKKGIACIQFDGRRIISGSNDNTIRIFDHASGAEVACLEGHSDLVRTVQAGFGDLPDAEETLRLEALAVENNFWEAYQAGDAVDLGPRALRRAGHHQNTTGSRNPRDIKALGARIPPGGGGSRWARIVSGSYDEDVIVWKKDKKNQWTVAQKLSYQTGVRNAQAAALAEAPALASRREPRTRAVSAVSTNAGPAVEINEEQPQPQQQPQPQPQPQPQGTAANLTGFPGQPNRRHRHNAPHPPRVFNLQFDARKIICGSSDPYIVGWDFAGLDEDLQEACQFFTSL